MGDIRRNAQILSSQGSVEIMQKGEVLSADQIRSLKGPIRLRIAAEDY